MFIWLVCLWLCAILSLLNLQITLAPCILLIFCTIEYFVLHKIFLPALAADYFPLHYMHFLSSVSIII